MTTARNGRIRALTNTLLAKYRGGTVNSSGSDRFCDTSGARH